MSKWKQYCFRPRLSLLFYVLFFIFALVWAAWWMGDVFRIAYEYSFFAADSTLMHWLWQQKLGPLYIVGRALLTLFHWPVVGGLLVATLLTCGSWLIGYCLRLSRRWRWLQFVPATIWMWWTAGVGLNLYYMREPGRILAWPLLVVVTCTILATAIYFSQRSRGVVPSPYDGNARKRKASYYCECSVFLILFLIVSFVLPMWHLNRSHPYMRPLTHMQVQLLHGDYDGMVRTAHDHATMSYRQMAGFYVIALARTGHLADQLFDIKLEYDTVCAYGYSGQPSKCLNYHAVDCNYHAGLIRAARHTAMEELTMDGPSLYTLKMLGKIALIEGDWEQARKYLHIINKVPFEGEFVRKYKPMLSRPDLVQSDPEFAAVIKALPAHHVIENIYERPCFVGYYASTRNYDNTESLIWSAMACLYSRRMPDFLVRCQQLGGATLPRSIAEGLVTQVPKVPSILDAFPQLEMDVERFRYFLEVAQPYMDDRERGGEELFNAYRGYYPYYYFFGNIHSARKPSTDEHEQNRAGVN